MCIIVEKPQNVAIPKAWHSEFWLKNSDGMGVVYWLAGKPVVWKTLDKKAAWVFLQSLADKEAIIHYRMATHGTVSLDMAHPFEIIKGFYFIHNGIVEAPADKDRTLSDTARLVKHVLRPLLENAENPAEYVRSGSFRFVLEKLLGSGNRAVICDAGGHVLFNRHLWHKLSSLAGLLSGVMVSNTYAWSYPYGKPKVTTYPGQDWTMPHDWRQKPVQPPVKSAAASAAVFATTAAVCVASQTVAAASQPIPEMTQQDIWDKWEREYLSNLEKEEADGNAADDSEAFAELDYAPAMMENPRDMKYSDLADWVTENPFEATDFLYDYFEEERKGYR